MWRRIRQLRRQRARRRFFAFLWIVLYGVVLAAIDFRGYEHATLAKWFVAAFLGGFVYIFVNGLIGEDDGDAYDDGPLERYDGDYGDVGE